MNNLNKIINALKIGSYAFTVMALVVIVIALNSADDTQTTSNPTELLLTGGEVTRTVQYQGQTMTYVRYGDVYVAIVDGELRSARLEGKVLNLKNEVK